MIDARIKEHFENQPAELTTLLTSLGVCRSDNLTKQNIVKAFLSIVALQTETGGGVNFLKIAKLFNRDPSLVRSMVAGLTKSGNLEKVADQNQKVKAYVAKGLFKEYQFKLLQELQIPIVAEMQESKGCLPFKTEEEIYDLMTEMHFTRFDGLLKLFNRVIRGRQKYSPLFTIYWVGTALTEVESLEADEDFPASKREVLLQYREAFLKDYRETYAACLLLENPDLSRVNQAWLD